MHASHAHRSKAPAAPSVQAKPTPGSRAGSAALKGMSFAEGEAALAAPAFRGVGGPGGKPVQQKGPGPNSDRKGHGARFTKQDRADDAADDEREADERRAAADDKVKKEGAGIRKDAERKAQDTPSAAAQKRFAELQAKVTEINDERAMLDRWFKVLGDSDRAADKINGRLDALTAATRAVTDISDELVFELGEDATLDGPRWKLKAQAKRLVRKLRKDLIQSHRNWVAAHARATGSSGPGVQLLILWRLIAFERWAKRVRWG